MANRRQRVAAATKKASEQEVEPDWFDVCTVGEALQRAVKIHPGDAELVSMFAQTLRQNPELLSDAQRMQPEFASPAALEKSADQAMDELVEAADAKPEAWLARHLYRQAYKLPGVDEDIAAALARGADDTRTLRVAARYYYVQAQQARQLESRPASETQTEGPSRPNRQRTRRKS